MQQFIISTFLNRRCHLVDKNPLLGADQTDVDDTADDEWAEVAAQERQCHVNVVVRWYGQQPLLWPT